MTALPASGLALRTLISADGGLKMFLIDQPVPALADHEILVRVEAAPINPSDLALLTGPADLSTAQAGGAGATKVLTASIPEPFRKYVAGRFGEALPAGNEGAGVVIAAGKDEAAQKLLGKTVALANGAMYAQYAIAPAMMVLQLPDGVTPVQGASAFVNPLTALSMVETMRMEGYKALVHTAAASNLGQMLVRLTKAEGIGLVNIVRSPAQAQILRDLGAVHVVDSTAPGFEADLEAAITATGAMLAFDAIGGGKLAGQILSAMERVASKSGPYSRYGSSTMKQVYVYGGLDTGPTSFNRSFGLIWGIGGWLLTPFLQKAGMETVMRLRARVAAEITTTFASAYTAELSFDQMLDPATARAYAAKATGQKMLLKPWA
ncbi:MAG: zinc-binding dehydrogenase [Caulobacterales bacterium]|jgi:NADPH:quinone reductase-like Zn-dependent oxidoreductase